MKRPHCHFQNVRCLRSASAFSAITQIVARFFVGRRIGAGSRALGLGKRGATGFIRTDGGQAIRMIENTDKVTTPANA